METLPQVAEVAEVAEVAKVAEVAAVAAADVAGIFAMADDTTHLEPLYDPRNDVRTLDKDGLTCESCGETFPQRSLYLIHQRVHNMAKPFVCGEPHCDLRFATRSSLKRHSRTHTGERPYRCYFVGCNKVFAQPSHLTIHVRTHTGEKPYPCEHLSCSLSFATRSDLKMHFRTHTGERPYACAELGCNKRFARLSDLRTHEFVHTGEKPFVCTTPDCGKSFYKSSDLSKHVRTHTGERPYICTVPKCGKQYAQRSNLVTHLRTHAKLKKGESRLSISELKQYIYHTGKQKTQQRRMLASATGFTTIKLSEEAKALAKAAENAVRASVLMASSNVEIDGMDEEMPPVVRRPFAAPAVATAAVSSAAVAPTAAALPSDSAVYAAEAPAFMQANVAMRSQGDPVVEPPGFMRTDAMDCDTAPLIAHPQLAYLHLPEVPVVPTAVPAEIPAVVLSGTVTGPPALPKGMLAVSHGEVGAVPAVAIPPPPVSKAPVAQTIRKSAFGLVKKVKQTEDPKAPVPVRSAPVRRSFLALKYADEVNTIMVSTPPVHPEASRHVAKRKRTVSPPAVSRNLEQKAGPSPQKDQAPSGPASFGSGKLSGVIPVTIAAPGDNIGQTSLKKYHDIVTMDLQKYHDLMMNATGPFGGYNPNSFPGQFPPQMTQNQKNQQQFQNHMAGHLHGSMR